tara:strand:+ start:12846 stop:16097 length:3252 start_codon:yes stop_codon:yes gene_type:complete
MNAELYSSVVFKVAGYDLSKNDFTDLLLAKLNALDINAEANVQSNWNDLDPTSDAYILNKPIFTSTDIIVSAIWSGTGFEFNVTADAFPVNGVSYPATPATVTLDASDATLDRIDLIVAIKPTSPDTVGTVGKITGTPASTSLVVPPDYDPSIYYIIKQISVNAAATIPAGAVNTLIFDEGTEWVPTLTANLVINTSDPSVGVNCIEATNNTDADSASFTGPAPLSTADLDLLEFDLKLKEAVSGRGIYVVLYLAGVLVDKFIFSAPTGLFDDTNLGYQRISLTKSVLNFPIANYDALVIRPFWSSTGYFLDNVRIFAGSGSGEGLNDYLLRQNNLSDLLDTAAARTNLGAASTAQGILADNSVQLTGETSQTINGNVVVNGVLKVTSNGIESPLFGDLNFKTLGNSDNEGFLFRDANNLVVASIFRTGAASFLSNVTATNFIGSGSQLTGVASTAQGVLADSALQPFIDNTNVIFRSDGSNTFNISRNGNIDGSSPFLDMLCDTSSTRLRATGGLSFWNRVLNGTFSESARFTGNGDFGIGTITPKSKLDVNGILSVGNGVSAVSIEAIRFVRDLDSSRYQSIFTTSTAVAETNLIEFKVHDAVAPTSQITALALTGLGRAGIGTITPLAPLHISNTAGGKIYLQDSDASLGQLHEITSSTNNFQLGTRTSAGTFVDTFYQAIGSASGTNIQQWNILGVNKMTLNNSGLFVNGGDIRITDTFPALILDGTTGGNVWGFIEVASGNLEIRVNDLQKIFIDASGNTQINGNVTATNFIGSGSQLTGVASAAQGVLADNSVQLTGEVSQAIDGRLGLNDGGNSVYVGTNAGSFDNGTLNFNVGVGYRALFSNTSGVFNTANGSYALYLNTTGERNTSDGYQSLYSNTTGYYNAANGYRALFANTTGFRNTALGFQAGANTNALAANQTSNNSIYLGNDTRALASGDTNEIVIGSTAQGNGSNTVTLGNDSITDTYLKGSARANSFIAPLITIVENTSLTVSNSEVIIDAATQEVIATLPAVASVPVNKKYTVIAYDAANTITLGTSNSEQIRLVKTDVLTSINLTSGNIYTVANTGTYWQIINKI